AAMTKPFECLVKDKIGGEKAKEMLSVPMPSVTTGATLHTYRAAIAGTGEHTAKFPPGTKDAALNNGIIPTINSLDAMLEREFTIHYAHIAAHPSILLKDPYHDPNPATNQATQPKQHQSPLDTKNGAANHHIGHVSRGVDGNAIAYLGAT